VLKEKPLRTGLFVPVELSFFHDERVSALAKERSENPLLTGARVLRVRVRCFERGVHELGGEEIQRVAELDFRGPWFAEQMVAVGLAERGEDGRYRVFSGSDAGVGVRCRSEKLWRWFVSLGFDERTWDEWSGAFAGGEHERLERWLNDARLEAMDKPEVLDPRPNKPQSRRARASEWLRRWLGVCAESAARGRGLEGRRPKTRAEIVSEANEALLEGVRRGGAVDEVKAAIVGLAELFRESLSARQLALYAEALSEFSPEEVKRAIREIALEDPTVTRFPLPSSIRARIRPPESVMAEANEAANRIVGAMEKFGWNNADAARKYIGELGWAVVERQGSWASLCENTMASDIPILKAQWREQAKAIYERARLGHHDTPPAIPAARSAIPLVQQLAATLSLDRPAKP
jgi:hypothetical protein